MLKRLIGAGVSIAVLVLIGIGITAYQKNKDKEDAPDVGECVTVTGSFASAEVEEAECGAEGVLYKVTSDEGDCDPNESNYTVTYDDGDKAVDLCLWWDVEEADCLKLGVNTEEKVSCDEATAAGDVYEVTAVHDSAGEKCGRTELPIPNEKRDELVCLALVV